MRVRLLVRYRGEAFHGFQIQNNVTTVQGALTDAVATLLRGRHTVMGASRTDSGVHALGQVAAFDCADDTNLFAMFRGLNALTPREMAITHLESVDRDFHPRHSARGKVYRYQLWRGRWEDPFHRLTTLHVRRPLDVQRMRAAAAHLVGEHDFSSFRGAGCDAPTTIRTLHTVRIDDLGPRVVIEVRGTAFLKYMVRILVGTILEVGIGRRDPDWVLEVMAARQRELAGPTAPARGLTLCHIFYPDFPWDPAGGMTEK